MKHALAVDDILDTLLLTAGTRATCTEPEPWAGQRARRTGPRKGPDPEYQRGVFGDRFCRLARHIHNRALQGQQQTPEE